jgi:exosortase A-associated hydrolase 1
MTRRHLIIDCQGSAMAATLDGVCEGAKAALLIVSGGNEVRSGAWGGQAWLAAQIAGASVPVLRFDRRGVGDSEGDNATYRDAGADIAAAMAFLREAVPGARIIAMGNCDAASALMLSAGAGADGLILCNPWTIEGEDEGASQEARAGAQVASLRAHYRSRLTNPAALLRLLSGKVSLRGLLGSALAMMRRKPAATPDDLAGRMRAGLARFGGPVSILIAGRDRTAQVFLGVWDASDARIRRCESAGHSFVEEEAKAWLVERVLEGVKG